MNSNAEKALAEIVGVLQKYKIALPVPSTGLINVVHDTTINKMLMPVSGEIPLIAEAISQYKNTPKKPVYRGDNGILRKCLVEAGYSECTTNSSIYNDASKVTDQRRLKLWRADEVGRSSSEQKEKLDKALKHYFGDRFISCGLIEAVSCYATHSFVVYITK